MCTIIAAMNLRNTLLLFFIIVILYFYRRLRNTYSYFERNGIPYIKPVFLFGNIKDVILVRKPLAEVICDFYKKLSPYKFGGVFFLMKKGFVISDPDLIRNVLVKDFQYFRDRGVNVNTEIEPLTNFLFFLNGDQWKNLRIKMTTLFTSGKMKMMFPLAKKCSEKLNKVVGQIPLEEDFDIKELNARYTTDVISTCAFGLETNSLDDPKSEFREMGKKLIKFRYQTLVRTAWKEMPLKIIKLFRLTFFDEKAQEFFANIIYKTLKYREQNQITRYDFLDLLIAMKNNTITEKFHDNHHSEDLEKFLAQVGDKLIKSNVEMTNELLAAQCFMFFLAGFETSATTLGYAMLELALNPDIQDKMRCEIRDVLDNNDGQLTYDAMKQMTYVDIVIAETLRKHPPVAFIIRECNQDYVIPGSEAIVPANTSIFISIYGLHRDERYYNNPEQFLPERFTAEESARRPKYTYMPFGEGPRKCIAGRLGIMKVKIALIALIKDYSYRVSPRMKFPIELEKNFGLLTSRDGIWLQRIQL